MQCNLINLTLFYFRMRETPAIESLYNVATMHDDSPIICRVSFGQELVWGYCTDKLMSPEHLDRRTGYTQQIFISWIETLLFAIVFTFFLEGATFENDFCELRGEFKCKLVTAMSKCLKTNKTSLIYYIILIYYY